tara:strand:+ start:304 stop:495 length:192 start_codon:yes stop_codon:yes gene_type:complete
MYNHFIEFLNRIGGILAWVGLWNLLIYVVKEEDVIGNVFLFLLGLIFWFFTDEFNPELRSQSR